MDDLESHKHENTQEIITLDNIDQIQDTNEQPDTVTSLLNDQDFMQKVNVASTLLFEVYRVLMGAFLLVFVPQDCNGSLCTFGDNISKSTSLNTAGLITNLVTMASFLILYTIEVRRENKLITYLDVNRFTPVDNESVGIALEKLDDKRRKTILDYDTHYYNSAMVSTVFFIANTAFSSVIIFNHYLDNSTVTVLLTNVLFMGLKVNQVYSIVKTKKNVFYSAYLTNKVQYNDVDPDKLHIVPTSELPTSQLPTSDV